jgi:hypothetical protein
MQSRLTACKFLLIAPVLFLILQVALALHHHHSESYHDDKDSLHSFPTAFYPDHIKLDTLICLAPDDLSFPPSIARIRDPDSPKAPVTVLITDPPQSRAPPPALRS